METYLTTIAPRNKTRPNMDNWYEPHYNKTSTLLTLNEQTFLEKLQSVVPDHLTVVCKVHALSVLCPASKANCLRWRQERDKIRSRYFDFVVCESSTFRIKAAIQLHAIAIGQERDALIYASEDAQLPLFNIRPESFYDEKSLAVIFEVIDAGENTS